MNKTLFLALLLLISCNAFGASEQISRGRTVNDISAYQNIVFVRFSPGISLNQGCPRDNSNELAMNLTTQEGQAMYSTLLAAAIADKKVGFGVNGCLSDRPLIYRVDVVVN